MDLSQFRFDASSRLDSFDTYFDGGGDKDELKDQRDQEYERLHALQERLYAEREQSLLVVLQAMDAAGKDSSIEKLTGRLNAQSCKVHSFKKPTELEMSHDFLWRIHQRVPAKGEIGLFNRSHYEDVLIVKVHGWASPEVIERRYDYIASFESLLAERGTKVVKFMLNISPEYQLSRFRNRLENAEKHWKFNPGDLTERAHWDDYMEAFETAMQKTSTDAAPWYVVPAEHRRFRDYMIAKILADELEAMDPQFPEPDFELADYPPDELS